MTVFRLGAHWPPESVFWKKWDFLSSEERKEIEEDYDRNSTYKARKKQKQGSYGDD